MLDSETGQEDVGIADLMVDLARAPVEHGGEQVFEDAFGGTLGRVAETLLLAQPLRTQILERAPVGADPLVAAPVCRQILECAQFLHLPELASTHFTRAGIPPAKGLPQ